MTVAGSDSGAGAGIQADLKTFSALKTYGLTAVTAVTAQNTRQVYDLLPMPSELVVAQMSALFEDFPVRAIKLGMLADESIVAGVAEKLADYASVPLVLDPVVISSSGKTLLSEKGVGLLIEKLIPQTALLTPNVDEAALLINKEVAFVLRHPERSAKCLLEMGAEAVLLKGGHRGGEDSKDVLISETGVTVLSAKRVNTRNNHGTGCTLSAAIAAFIAKGLDLESSVKEAKNYIQSCLLAADELDLGGGAGPLKHFHF
ncbi:MAG: bifunctional hydroxymethylpyrimidine kinase/phosphomethylpyrimidine kinase [Motiliproteus sp.]|nr:bifunctional hydroxymethylpyrimidine kinase/phosphomethylpyrimidine kinase [Motiliproteus sp.]MCW9053542.1 bifunctional hydroxymethylpyrimidine kinase/phosphomethylpyrimidine kinase [Motiliproteus sp.]